MGTFFEITNCDSKIYTRRGRDTIEGKVNPGRTNRNPVATTSRSNSESGYTTIEEQIFDC